VFKPSFILDPQGLFLVQPHDTGIDPRNQIWVPTKATTENEHLRVAVEGSVSILRRLVRYGNAGGLRTRTFGRLCLAAKTACTWSQIDLTTSRMVGSNMALSSFLAPELEFRPPDGPVPGDKGKDNG
jgi:hypothetical protein